MAYQNQDNRQKSIGALWIQQSKKGMQYMSGVVEINGTKHKIVCFANKKMKDNHPDYTILLSEDRPAQSEQSEQSALQKQWDQPAQTLPSEAPQEDEIRVEDIPF